MLGMVCVAVTGWCCASRQTVYIWPSLSKYILYYGSRVNINERIIEGTRGLPPLRMEIRSSHFFASRAGMRGWLTLTTAVTVHCTTVQYSAVVQTV